MSKQLSITLRRSLAGRPQDQRDTARSLGLTCMHKTVRQPDNPCVRGMVFKIKHLVEMVEEEQA